MWVVLHTSSTEMLLVVDRLTAGGGWEMSMRLGPWLPMVPIKVMTVSEAISKAIIIILISPQSFLLLQYDQADKRWSNQPAGIGDKTRQGI
jgi:hypothetical protein